MRERVAGKTELTYGVGLSAGKRDARGAGLGCGGKRERGPCALAGRREGKRCWDAGPDELLGPREGAGPLRVVLGRPRGLGRAGHWAERERKKGKWAG